MGLGGSDTLVDINIDMVGSWRGIIASSFGYGDLQVLTQGRQVMYRQRLTPQVGPS